MDDCFYPATAADQTDTDIVHDCYRIRGVDRRAIDQVIDIGSRDGTFALLARMLFPSSKVLAIEADPGAAQYLHQHRFRGLDIDVLSAMIGDGGSYELQPLGPCSYLQAAPGGRRSRTLTELASWAGYDPARTLLKVDAEGAEACLTASELMCYAEFRIELHTDHSRMPYTRSEAGWRQIARQITESRTHWCAITPIQSLSIHAGNCQIRLGHGYLIGGRLSSVDYRRGGG